MWMKFSRFSALFSSTLGVDTQKSAMTNEFYKPGEERAARVAALFATIARRYDLINDIQSFGLHRAWKRRLLSLARPHPGERALDLCCGTGDLTFALAKAGADAVGLDFSPEMLQVAQEKSKVQSPKSKVEFIRGDAQQIPFAENSFEIVTIGYGLRNLANLDVGLRDIWRVTKPGGRFLALEFGKPANPAWRAIYFGYLKFALPIFGKLFCGNSAAYAYILESLKHYPAQTAVADKLTDLGWRNVRIINLMGGIMSIHYAEKREK
jgi:demethylmenaquinone methyltransferase/2-methoxy-6-polyprenyl-1,4-benzoquinol methylase